MKTKTDHAKEAANAHANLNTWACVAALLEGGTLSGANTYRAQQRVIKIAHAEMQKHLKEYDAAMAKVS